MTPSPPSVVGLLDTVRAAVAELRRSAPGSGAGEWPHEARQAAIAGLDALIQELTVYRGQVLLAHQHDGRWGAGRDRDFADWRARQTGAGRGAALGDLELAQGLDQMPAVADAVERGALTLEHAKALTRLRATASAEVRQALEDGGLDDLLQRTARDRLTAPELGKQAKTWAAEVDAATAQADFTAVRRRRALTLRNHAGGVKGEFFLDPLAGAELRTALDAIAGRPAKDETRTTDQRLADALSTMAARTLQVGADLNGAQVRPHLSLLITQETWAGVLARRRPIETDPGDEPPPLPDVPPAELEDGTLVPLGELERLMCDCEITRMVLSATGIPLDVGRTQRTYTKELRRAVTTRDRHCQWPTCHLRASWCEVHHITWFSRGGKTSLSEGITLCSYHHHRVHELDIHITTRDDGFDFHHRDGRHLGTTRRSQPRSARPPARQTAPEPTPSPLPRPPHTPVNPKPPPPKVTGPHGATPAAPRPSHPATYATAPSTLWDPDPP